MTSDPMAPGAAAVYLYREETVDDNHHFHTYYARIKVLSEKGKELATQSFPYEKGNFKIGNIQGRTIHPDGTVIKLTAKPSDLLDVKAANYQVNKMVFTLPDVQVGSILEYRLALEYDDSIVMSPNWQVQQKYFVHKAHYFFYPSTSSYITNNRGEPLQHLMYYATPNSGLNVVRDAAGHYSVDTQDIPAIPDEDSMPPLNSFIRRVEFYYTYTVTGQDFWQNEARHWQKDTDKFANPSGAIKSAASSIVASGDSDEVKAQKLYDAVMKLENTDYGRAKTEAERKKEKTKEVKDAEGVWKQKSGTSDQLTQLYIALLRAAGLTAYPMQVVNRDRATFDANYLSTWQLDDFIAIAVIGGKEVYLDPGEKACPYGLLAWKHTLVGGLREGPKGNTMEGTPGNNYKQNSIDRVAGLELAPDGSVSGSIRLVMNGQEAVYWRQLAIRNDPDEVKKRFNEWMHDLVPDGVQVDFDHFLALEDYDKELIAMAKVSGQLATTTGRRFFVPGQFFASHSSHPFVAQEHRIIPVDVHYPERISDEVDYTLPDGFSVESTPEPDVIPWEGNAQLRISAGTQNKNVKIQRVFEYNYTLVSPTEYTALHDFFQKIAAADQQQLVLTRAAAAKGD